MWSDGIRLFIIQNKLKHILFNAKKFNNGKKYERILQIEPTNHTVVFDDIILVFRCLV